jgi:competence protein ComEC
MNVRYWGLLAITCTWLAGLLVAMLIAFTSWQVLLLASIVSIIVTIIITILGHITQNIPTVAVLIVWAIATFFLAMTRLVVAMPANDPHDISHISVGSQITLRGIVVQPPDIRDKGALLTVAVSDLQKDRHWITMDGTISLYLSLASPDAAPDYGDRVSITGTMLAPDGHTPPGISASIGQAHARVLAHREGNPLLAALYALRTKLAQGLLASMPASEAALAIGIVLGLKTPVLRARLPLFTRTGTIHLVVTSGLKVTLVASAIRAITRYLVGWCNLLVTLVGITGYVVLSGAGPAAIRAGIMGGILALAQSSKREYAAVHALAATTLIMTAISPYILWDVGFQLSAAGTLGIVILSPRLLPLVQQLCRCLHRSGAIIADVLTATLAAQLATLPIVALSFGSISLISPVSNILLVPFLDTFILLGSAQAIIATVLPQLGVLLGTIFWPIWRLADIVVEQSSALPGAALNAPPLPSWLIPVWLIMLAMTPLVWREMPQGQQQCKSHHKKAIMGLIARLATALVLFAVLVGIGLIRSSPPLTITFLDVGSGGPATVVRANDGTTMLIDGGADGSLLGVELGRVLPFWQRTIDLVVVTDVRPGHVSGLLPLLNSYHILAAADPGALHPDSVYTAWYTALQQRHIPLKRLSRGDRLMLGQVATLDVLAPASPAIEGTAQQDANALALRLVAPGVRVLFAGEAHERVTALSAGDGSAAYGVDITQFCLRDEQPFDITQPSADLIEKTRPHLVVISASARPKGRSSAASSSMDDPSLVAGRDVRRIERDGSLTIASDTHGWWIVP